MVQLPSEPRLKGNSSRFRRGGVLGLLEGHAGFGGQGHAACIGLADTVHPLQAQQHFAVKRNLPAHQPGIAALGHDRGPGLVADGEDRGDLLGGLQA